MMHLALFQPFLFKVVVGFSTIFVCMNSSIDMTMSIINQVLHKHIIDSHDHIGNINSSFDNLFFYYCGFNYSL